MSLQEIINLQQAYHNVYIKEVTKDEIDIGQHTGQLIPKKRMSPTKRYEFEKQRRQNLSKRPGDPAGDSKLILSLKNKAKKTGNYAEQSNYKKSNILTEKPYQIYGPDPHGPSDSESRPLGKPYKNKKRAKTRADKLDQDIGGYRHFVRKVEEAKAAKPPQEVLSKISKVYARKYKGVNVDAKASKKNIHLGDIFVPSDQRNKGIGSRVMKGLTKYADNQKMRMSLKQSPEPGKEKELDRFYKKSGFKKSRSKSKDVTHTRSPNK